MMTEFLVAPGVIQARTPVTEQQLRAAGVDLARDFPGASVEEFLEYPVLTEGGWFIVIKHQPTLTTASRKRWRLHGPIKLLTDGLDFG